MSVVFAVDDGGGEAGGGAHVHGGHRHQARLFLPDDAFDAGKFTGLAMPAGPPPAPGFTEIEISNKTIWLPFNGRYDPVRHDADEPVGRRGFDITCSLVGNDPNRWTPLTRLGNLNVLTSGAFDIDVENPDSRVQALVRLSGGRIACLRSYKALADAFFEFVDLDGTVTVQPGVEDVQFTVETDGDVQIGIGELGATEPATVLPFRSKAPIIMQALPPKDAPHPPNLNHFANFYKFMVPRAGKKLRKPFVRVCARCEDGRIVHTLGGKDGIRRDFLKEFVGANVLTTPGRCTCLVAAAFKPLS